jgi:hypothetical protein
MVMMETAVSTSDASELGTLVVKGHPGSEIRILDQNFGLRGKGTVLLRLDLAPGLYIINWKTAEVIQKDVVRVNAARERHVEAPPPPAATSSELAAETTAALTDLSRPSEIRRGADVVILLDVPPAGRSSELGIRLFAADKLGTAMRSDVGAVREARDHASDDPIAGVYHVAPGVYRLQYRGMTGEMLSQSVPAIAGRKTILFLRQGEGHVLVSAGETLETRTYMGIDPGLATMVSIPAGQPVAAHREVTRTASILLSDLANNRTSLGKDLMQSIERADCDPLLKLYAAGVILSRLERDMSPTLDQAYPTKRTERRIFQADWLRRAQRLVSRRTRKGWPVDFLVMRRRCAEDLRSRQKLPILESPPVLQASWRWAINGSFSNPRAIPESFSFRGVEQGAVNAPPWLVWRPAAAKAGATTQPVSSGGLVETLDRLVVSTSALIKMGGTGSERWQDLLAFLPADSSSLANTAIQVASQNTSPRDLSRQIADTIQVSARTLRSAAGQALADVDKALSAIRTGLPIEAIAGPIAGRSSAPALNRPVSYPDDPLRARFGGKASANGARLTATFGPVKHNKAWVQVLLKVFSDRPANGEVAEFFLHDTFDPDHLIVSFEGKVAQLQFVAYGGFTVGVWLPSRLTELELDLSTAPKAPSVIRNR